MSTMKVTNLKHESSSVNNIVLNSDGSVGGELGDALASKLPYSYGTATPSTTDSGFLWYDSNSTPAAPKFWDGAAFQALTSGKILQVVRATDSTERSTTSTSFVDVTGMSVTITPQKSSSAVIIIASMTTDINTTTARGNWQITDSSNNAISGAEGSAYGSGTSFIELPVVLVGYATPATTSAVTYKVRFKVGNAAWTIKARNQISTGQVYALEIAA